MSAFASPIAPGAGDPIQEAMSRRNMGASPMSQQSPMSPSAQPLPQAPQGGGAMQMPQPGQGMPMTAPQTMASSGAMNPNVGFILKAMNERLKHESDMEKSQLPMGSA